MTPKIIRFVFFTAAMLLFSFHMKSQESLDSLLRIAKASETPDSLRAACLNLAALEVIFSNPDSAALLAREALEISQSANISAQITTSYDHIARVWWMKGELDSSLFYINSKLEYYTRHRDTLGIAGSLNNKGMIMENKGLYLQSLKLYLQAIQLLEKKQAINRTDSNQVDARLASTYNNAANIYARQNDNQDALRIYNKALESNLRLNEEAHVAVNYLNIGIIYTKQDQFDIGLEFYKKALQIHSKLNNIHGMSEVYLNMGLLYVEMKAPDKALDVLKKAEKLALETGDEYNLITSYVGLADACLYLKNYPLALQYLKKGEEISNRHEFKEEQMFIYRKRGLIYKGMGNYMEAYTSAMQYINLKDSLYSENHTRQVEELKTIYETEKKEKENLLLKKDHEHDLDLLQHKSRIIEEQNTKNILYMAVAVLLLIAAIIAIRAYVLKQKTHKIISIQKKEVEEKNEELNQQNEEIAAQRDQIENQRKIVEQKNLEVTSSITYARRIQTAILPFKNSFISQFADAFIYYKPKDIVAGDFYWMEKTGNKVVFAVADCTGHGVPGAMVSVVCHNALNRAVREFKLTEPAAILNKTREVVVETFEGGDDYVQDGMDISVCCWDQSTNKLHFAGANNPLYLVVEEGTMDSSIMSSSKTITHDGVQIVEIKADNQPVGDIPNPVKFTGYELDITHVKAAYLFSDGYADQFGFNQKYGGKPGKKFGYKNLRKLLFDIHQYPMEKQYEILESEFLIWIGNEEQVDDLCIIGVKF